MKAMKRMLSLVMAGALTVGGMALVGCSKDETPAPNAPTTASKAVSYVTIDINPSFELMVEGDGTVLTCTAVNEDAEVVLDAVEDLTGSTLEEAVEAIVDESAEQGYLTEENADVATDIVEGDEESGAVLEEIVTETVEKVRKKEGKAFIRHLHANKEKLTDSLKALKEQYADNEAVQALTPGMFRLIEQVMEYCDIEIEEALEMSVADLMKALKEVREEQKGEKLAARREMNKARKEFNEKCNREALVAAIEAYLTVHPELMSVEDFEAVLAALETLENEETPVDAVALETLLDTLAALELPEIFTIPEIDVTDEEAAELLEEALEEGLELLEENILKNDLARPLFETAKKGFKLEGKTRDEYVDMHREHKPAA